MAEYLTIADFAERAGVSKQAVYSRLNQESIRYFVKVENGKKLINSDAIRFFKSLNNQPKSLNSSKESTAKSKVVQSETIDLLKKQIEKLEAEKQELSKQLTLSLQIQAADKIELAELRQQIRLLTAGTAAPSEPVAADQEAKTSDAPSTAEPVKKSFWKRLDEWFTL